MANELIALVFPLYSEQRLNTQGNQEQTMNYDDYNHFMALFYTPEELLQNDANFRNAFRHYDTDNNNLLDLTEFTQLVIALDNHRNHDVIPRIQQLVAPHNQNEQDDRAVIERLFRFFDFDNSGGLDRNEIENFFANIPYPNLYNAHTFDRFDVNHDGSLSIDEFTQLLIQLNTYLGSQGITNFVAFVRQIVSPETVVAQTAVTQPVAQPVTVFVSQIPSPDTIVPGTQHTYGELGEAFTLQPGVVINNASCMAIHNAASRLRNPALGFDILIDFNREMGEDVPQLTYHPTPQQVADLEAYIMDSLVNFLSRSETPAFQNEQQRRTMITGILQVIHQYYDSTFTIGNVQYSGYVGFYLVITFMTYQSNGFQTLWAENFVTDCIEAYDARISTYQLGQHISCGGGIAERNLMAIGNVLSTGSVPAPNAATAATAASNVLSPEEITSARNLRRTGLLNRWLQLYYQGLGDQDFTEGGLRTFINTKIRESDEDNNPDSWVDAINTFVGSDGVRMFMGGARKYPRRINIFNVLFGKKQKRSLKRMSKTKYTKKNKEKMGKTKRLRKYKKKMAQHAKKSTRKRRF
jgi:Ca2+-binding EF-hand superfamily protein